MSDFENDYDYLRSDEPCNVGLDERRAIAWLNRVFPVKHDASTVPGVKTMLFLLEEAEEGGYVASVVTRPGCITKGETIPETLENLAYVWRLLDKAQPK